MPSQSHRPRGSAGLALTSAALRRGDVKISDPIPFDESGDAFSHSKPVIQSFHSSGYRHDDASWLRNNHPTQEAHTRYVSDLRAYAGARDSLEPSSLPRSMSSIPSKASLDQRKPGGIRAALKRIFSSRRHTSAPTGSNGYQYGNHNRLLSVSEQPTQPRVDPASPSETLSRGAALRSHSTHQQADSLKQSSPILLRRGRRNTLPSMVFNDKESGLDHTIANWGRASHNEWPKEDYVSDSQLNRRSRSADALNERQRQEDYRSSYIRDRASEIAYWRTSAIENPVPVYSGQFIAVDPGHVLCPGKSAVDLAPVPGSASPMQSFEFGLNSTDRDSTALEQRVNTLEIKLFDFEYAIAKLQGNNIQKPMVHAKTFARGAVHNVFPGSNTHLAMTSGPSPNLNRRCSPKTVHASTFLSSPGESPPSSPEEGKRVRPQRASTATTVTIRPSSARRRSASRSSRTSQSSIHMSADKFRALMGLIEEEKVARQQLEAQVIELQKELEDMRTPIYATIRDAYPTPSPESAHDSSGTPRTLHRTHGFQLSHSGSEISRFSETDPDSDPTEGLGVKQRYF
ncbi:hypothetical protein A1O3_10306 [Capronia epimyces CBS 606.96]|uniref:Uncharacterized protein n=1 Tax=Capronia epimyces CBS 606.96 TaxID=1182542 RepID=W9XA81_9EURO|nr:uncharacterized protein A1O3_10306 [Capronia epimyces CBS 606.96]EXJ77148.1 hypothetical protein A1O3_10306 [Capronia epimyces CBS 606.96]